MRNIGKIGIVGCVATAMFYLFPLGMNHLASGEHNDGVNHSVKEPDGAWSWTEYNQHDGCFRYDGVTQAGVFSSKALIDDAYQKGVPREFREVDGLVDEIVVESWGKTTVLLRKRDYDTNKEKFDEADKLLAETKERFKEYFKSKTRESK